MNNGIDEFYKRFSSILIWGENLFNAPQGVGAKLRFKIAL